MDFAEVITSGLPNVNWKGNDKIHSAWIIFSEVAFYGFTKLLIECKICDAWMLAICNMKHGYKFIASFSSFCVMNEPSDPKVHLNPELNKKFCKITTFVDCNFEIYRFCNWFSLNGKRQFI